MTSKMKILGTLIAGSGLLVLAGLNRNLQINRKTLEFEELPESFDGLRIAFLSDLHARSYPDLLPSIQEEKPDLILLTGDIYDGAKPSEHVTALLRQLSEAAPVYGVSGNHEKYRKDWPMLRDLTSDSVQWLENEKVRLERNGQSIEIVGMDDPGQTVHTEAHQKMDLFFESLRSVPESRDFAIALIHRPQFAYAANRKDWNLILSGHIHGGQWRIFDQGVAGPGLAHRIDLLPVFDRGLYELPHSTMFVSRGLGDQMKIPRWNNRPELIFLTLKKGGNEIHAL